MHHQVEKFGNLGLKGFGFDSGFSGRHLLLTERSEKSRYSAPGFKIKFISQPLALSPGPRRALCGRQIARS
jgi:hypothetical protein